jgi:pimeloyl-ACP methyl ester carboxylesterase
MRAAQHRVRDFRVRAVAVAAVVLVVSLGAVGAAAQRPSTAEPKPTIVLVHGAFADAGGWNGVSERLVRKGYNVIAPANPLRGVASDVQYLKDFLDTVPGPIVLVGHSYGGFVMTNAATGDADVEALVYIAAFAPDAGETVGGISASAPGSMLGPAALTVRPYVRADGSEGADGYITPSAYREVFAADLPRAEAWTFAISQRPAELSILGEPSGDPAWKTIPAWTLVATEDRVIPPDAQRAMAARAGATTVEATGSHSIAVSRPSKVTDLIIRAARAVS